MKKCTACGEDIHPKRLEILPNTTKCVECSTQGKKAGVSVVLGEGDHTYNEIVIMEPEEFELYQELETKLYGVREDSITHPEEEIEEEEINGIDLDDEDLEEDELEILKGFEPTGLELDDEF